MATHWAFTRRSLIETLVSIGRARMKSADRYAETAADCAGIGDDRAGASEAYLSSAWACYDAAGAYIEASDLYMAPGDEHDLVLAEACLDLSELCAKLVGARLELGKIYEDETSPDG